MSEVSDVSSFPTRSVGGIVNEAPNTLIMTGQFDGSNYLPWYHSTQSFIIGKGKFGYLTGDTKAPDLEPTTFPKWQAKNVTMMSCFLHSMQPEIANTPMYLLIAKAIWDSIIETYSKKGNNARTYELRQKVSQLKQVTNLSYTTLFLKVYCRRLIIKRSIVLNVLKIWWITVEKLRRIIILISWQA